MKIPRARKATSPTPCKHRTTKRKGPFTVDLPKGKVQYYQVWCTDKCKKWRSNETPEGDKFKKGKKN